MLAKSGLILAAAFGIVLLTAGAADAQVVAFNGSGYQPAQGGQTVTIAPYGIFSTPMYPNGGGGKYRVAIDYGQFSFGNFAPYALNTQGIPNKDYTAAQDAGRGGNFNWAMPRKNASGIDQNSYIRAQLQQSTDGGMTWTNVGSPSYLRCF
jgi:hypothetical protein